MSKRKKYVLLTEECFRSIQIESTECIVEKTKENQLKGQARENLLIQIKETKQRIAKIEEELKITIKKINLNNQEMKMAKKFSDKINDSYNPDNEIFVDIEGKLVKHKAPKKLGKYVLLTEENFRIIQNQTTNCIAEKTKENQEIILAREPLLTSLQILRERLLDYQKKLIAINKEIYFNNQELKSTKKFSKNINDSYSSGKDFLVEKETQKIKMKRKKR